MLKIYRIIAVIGLLLLFSNCGGDNKSTDTAEAKKVEFKLTGNDQMKYNLNTMVVKEGEEVTVHFENIGKMAKEVMGHNFVLLKTGVDLPTFAAKAMTAKENEYIPTDEVDNIIVHSKMLGPGEKTVIEFTAPAKGSYKYI